MREILFYDIPAACSDREIATLLGSIRVIEKLAIKKQFKYASVRATI